MTILNKNFFSAVFLLFFLAETGMFFVQATEEISVNTDYAKTFKMYKLFQKDRPLQAGKIYDLGARITHYGIYNLGLAIHYYYIFDNEYSLYITSKYKYFTGYCFFWMKERLKLPEEVFGHRPSEVKCYIYLTTAWGIKDDVLIASFSYPVQ